MMIKAIYVYTNKLGWPVLRKIRTAPGKHFSIEVARYANDKIYWKSHRGALVRYQPDWSGRAMYNLPVLLDALAHNEPTFLVEGELDCDTLASLMRVAATTNYQGAGAFTEEQAAWFNWHRSKSMINVIQDNDLAGSWALWNRYTTLIRGGVDKSRIRLWRPTGDAKDITDVFLCGNRRKPVERVTRRAAEEAASAEGAAEAAQQYRKKPGGKGGGSNPQTGYAWGDAFEASPEEVTQLKAWTPTLAKSTKARS